MHDLGGREGFGPVAIEPDEPVFHERWEGRVFGTTAGVLMAGMTNGPTFRHSIERMDPRHYLGSTYYEHWLTGVSTLLVEQGVLTVEELEAAADGPYPLSRPAAVGPDDIDAGLLREGPVCAVGDRVRVRDMHFGGHTRCPGFVRGRTGVVVRVDDEAPLPELEGHRGEIVRDPTYSVRFAATELWGERADPNAAVHVDLYSRYLEPVGP